jgi:hypothetical protein
MGMVPIPGISPLTLSRPEESVLEPPLPVSRVDPESSDAGGQADEEYSPSQEALPLQGSGETEPQATTLDPAHQVNLFA